MKEEKIKMELILKVSDALSLCQPHQSHRRIIFELLQNSRPYLEQWIPWVGKTRTMEDLDAFIKEARMFNVGGQKFNAMIFEENDFLGMIGMPRIDKVNKKAELGYWLKEEAQGKGIIRRCMPKILSHAFRQMDINRLELIIGVENVKSRATAIHSGFKEEGILRDYFYLNGKFHDAYVFSMLSREASEEED